MMLTIILRGGTSYEVQDNEAVKAFKDWLNGMGYSRGAEFTALEAKSLVDDDAFKPRPIWIAFKAIDSMSPAD